MVAKGMSAVLPAEQSGDLGDLGRIGAAIGRIGAAMGRAT
jgi:hypothetical protein